MTTDLTTAASAQSTLEWALQTYRGRIALACSFGGPSGMVLVDMAVRIDPAVAVYFLDTGVLFSQTYATVERVKERYGITPIAVAPEFSIAQQAEHFGDELWLRDPDACCRMRKVEPQRAFLTGFEAWITGVRRDQSSTRATVAQITWDETFSVTKINPLALWSEADVWEYIQEHDVPYNALHDAGYPSIGCTHCTRPVEAGADARSGRWQGFMKTECGLHARGVR